MSLLPVNNLAAYPVNRHTGNLDHYPTDGATWIANDPFWATMTIVETARGRSAAYFIWEDGDGHRWPMFMTDLTDLLRATVVECGTVTGLWQVRKRGQNYGLAAAAVPEVA